MPATSTRTPDRSAHDADDARAALPLARFKVLDLTHARAGPAGVRVLADWGADVLRIEQPPAEEELDEVVGKRDGFDYQNLHRNKRSMCINLKSPEGREIFMKLVKEADVVIENMRPSVKHRLGVDYETVSKINPRIVYGSMSGFGQYGPYAERPALDQIAQGMSGLMSVTGQRRHGTGPHRRGCHRPRLRRLPGAGHPDRAAGARGDRQGSLGADVAARDRDRTARLPGDALADQKTVPVQEGNFHPTVTPTGLYATKDGHINLSASGNRIFRRFCKAIGREDISSRSELRLKHLAGAEPRRPEQDRGRGVVPEDDGGMDRASGAGGRALRPGQRH